MLRNASTVLLAATLLAACETETSEEPTPLAAPLETQFALVDSMKVSAAYQLAYPDFYASMNDKTYLVTSQNQSEVYYYEDQEGLTLYVKDASQGKEQPWLSFTFKNRSVKNLPAHVSLKDTAVVCVEDGQQFKDGSMAMSPGCTTVLDGSISLTYDQDTRVLSGAVTNLKFGIGYFVPSYAFPNHTGLFLSTSGSTRHVNLSFKNAKLRQM